MGRSLKYVETSFRGNLCELIVLYCRRRALTVREDIQRAIEFKEVGRGREKAGKGAGEGAAAAAMAHCSALPVERFNWSARARQAEAARGCCYEVEGARVTRPTATRRGEGGEREREREGERDAEAERGWDCSLSALSPGDSEP
eukprot:scaffold106223_cov26-Tisochrysis_lutea.AAC.1